MAGAAAIRRCIGALCLLPLLAGAQSDSVYIQSVQCLGGPYGLTLPTDARKIRKLGKVLREEMGDVEQWDGYSATRKTLHFAGLSLGIIEFSNDPSRLMVTHADLTSVEWNRLSPFKLRKPVADAQALLGEAAANDPDLKKSYGSESDSVQIQSSKGVVMGVSYSCYSG
jgi:hypothetical protein